MSAEKKAFSYDEAVVELEEILAQVEDSSMPIDELAPRIERATELVRGCRDVLARTEVRVTEALEALEAADEEASP